MRRPLIEVTFNTLDEYMPVRPMLEQIIADRLPPEDVFMMKVALNEAVNNALFHGGVHRQIPVRVRIDTTLRGRLLIRVKDQGDGFSVPEIMKKMQSVQTPEFYHIEEVSDSGRGLYFMCHAADRLVYNRQGNEVLIAKKMKPEGGNAHVGSSR